MKKIFLILILLPLFSISQTDSILSGVYTWKEPNQRGKSLLSTATILEGKVYDFEWFQLTANRLLQSDKMMFEQVPVDLEYLYIIKNGELKFSFHDSTYDLGNGSVVVLMPGEKYSVNAISKGASEFYLFKYKSKLSRDDKRGKTAGGSFVRDWSKIKFNPHGKGGVRNFFERPTAMSKRLEMHVSTLNGELKSHDPHTHRAEEIVLMIEGNTEMQIGEGFYKGKGGSVYYLGSNVLHAIRNTETTPCMYYAFQFE